MLKFSIDMEAQQQNNPRPKNRFTSNPGGVIVGGGNKIDEGVLEGKDPKVVEKNLADIELSLNGGIDKNEDPDAFEAITDPLHEDQNSVSADDTPSYNEDFYNGMNGNKVVDPEDYRQPNKTMNINIPAFPEDGIN
mmetsp:Transcript_24131/g.21447  ORF Transcript_24131/g.21447 Transcript_24131/m.21447 type:complete len:136 (+) Transcript_24131:682-1089(+)